MRHPAATPLLNERVGYLVDGLAVINTIPTEAHERERVAGLAHSHKSVGLPRRTTTSPCGSSIAPGCRCNASGLEARGQWATRDRPDVPGGATWISVVISAGCCCERPLRSPTSRNTLNVSVRQRIALHERLAVSHMSHTTALIQGAQF
jgi:hypothetical protein